MAARNAGGSYPYISGWCAHPEGHRRCVGHYAGADCHCPCHGVREQTQVTGEVAVPAAAPVG